MRAHCEAEADLQFCDALVLFAYGGLAFGQLCLF